MPYYHNFSWYYFLKYVVGFSGMLFLYSGILKEGTFSCVCAAEDRELARRKGENACDNYTRSNESSPTGGTTDAGAKRDVYTQSRVPVDVEREYTLMPTTTHREVEETAAFPKGHRTNYAANHNLQVYRAKLASLSSSDGNIEVQRHKRHRPDCRQALKNGQCSNRNTSFHNLKSVTCRELHCKDHCDKRLFDAVAKANIQVRNSFAKQEHLELEAFACLIVNQGIKPHFEDTIATSSASSNSSFQESLHREESPISNDEENSSTDNFESPEYYKIRYRVPFRSCRKHYPETPSTSFASVRSRSGSVYFTASSRGKKVECKIHGRCSKTSAKPESRLQRYRIVEESDESNEEIMRKELNVNRRRFGNRRAIRYRSRCN